MRHSDNQDTWRDDPLFAAEQRRPITLEDDGAPTLPSIVVRARIKNGATILAVITCIVLMGILVRALIALLPPITATTSSVAATHPRPPATATSATTATQGTPTNGTEVPGGGSVGTDTPPPGVATDTPVVGIATDTPLPGAQAPMATNTPRPQPTATPQPTAIPPTPLRVNLLINPGFESSGGWAVSAHSFNESGGHTGNVRHAHWDPTASYSAYTKQTVGHLTTGVYQATAWIETSCSTTGNHFAIIDATNGAQLAGYDIPSCLQNAWVQITLQATITHGQATVAFTSNVGAAQWLRMDDVTFMRLS